MTKPLAVIIGGAGELSAALARNLAPDCQLSLAARSPDKMQALAEETGEQCKPTTDSPKRWREVGSQVTVQTAS
jgi:short-subunit dehydrogenase